MELKHIKELMSEMSEHGLSEIVIKEKTGFELHLKKEKEQVTAVHHVQQSYPLLRHHEFPHIQQGAHPHLPQPQHPMLPTANGGQGSSVGSQEGKFVTSPMVGTFYLASSPEQPPFVKVGDEVNEHTVVCIIEAMKVMNEVKAGVSGTIAEICLDNSQPVEFGTKLFRIV